MIVAIAATGPDLDAEVCPHCRDCPYFLIVDSETMKMESIKKSGDMPGGPMGIGIGSFVANKGAKALIAGDCDRNAIQPPRFTGLRVIEGMTGKVGDVVKRCNTWYVPPIM